MEEQSIDLPVVELDKVEMTGGLEEKGGGLDLGLLLEPEVPARRREFDELMAMDSPTAKRNGVMLLADISDISLDLSLELPGFDGPVPSSKTTPTTTAPGVSENCDSPCEWVFPRPAALTTPAKPQTTPTLTSGEEWLLAKLFKDRTDRKDNSHSPDEEDVLIKVFEDAGFSGVDLVTSAVMDSEVGEVEGEGEGKEGVPEPDVCCGSGMKMLRESLNVPSGSAELSTGNSGVGLGELGRSVEVSVPRGVSDGLVESSMPAGGLESDSRTPDGSSGGESLISSVGSGGSSGSEASGELSSRSSVSGGSVLSEGSSGSRSAGSSGSGRSGTSGVCGGGSKPLKREPARSAVPRVYNRSKLPKVASKCVPKVPGAKTTTTAPGLKPSLLPRAGLASRISQKESALRLSHKPHLLSTESQKTSTEAGRRAFKSRISRPTSRIAAARGRPTCTSIPSRATTKAVAPTMRKSQDEGKKKSAIKCSSRDVVSSDMDEEPVIASKGGAPGVISLAPELGLVHSTPIDTVKQSVGGGGRGGGGGDGEEGEGVKVVHTLPQFTPIMPCELTSEDYNKTRVLNKTHSVKHPTCVAAAVAEPVPKLEMSTPKGRAKRKSLIPTPRGAMLQRIKLITKDSGSPNLDDGNIEIDLPLTKPVETAPIKAAPSTTRGAKAPLMKVTSQPVGSKAPTTKPRATNTGLQRSLKLRGVGAGRNLKGAGGRGVTGAGQRRVQKERENGPLKAVYDEFPVYDFEEKSNPRAKVMHSPIDKENVPASPHSQWSPIKKKHNLDDSCIRCTKRQKQ